MAKKILYIYGGLYNLNGMSAMITQKVNYLADYTGYEMYIVLTEHPERPWSYKLSDKVHVKYLEVNFDDLDTMPFYKKVICYFYKLRKAKKLLTDYMMSLRPDITVSITRREINFINQIQDGSKKIAEIHFARTYYRQFKKDYFPDFINQWISRTWMSSLIKHLKLLDKFVVLTEEDSHNWPELNNVVVIPNFVSEIPSEKTDCLPKRVIAVGRYSWQKGFDLLIAAWEIVFQSHNDWLLDIFGGGDYGNFQKLADSKGLSAVVHCHPAVSNIFEEYQKSGLFVLSSRFEGFGLVIVEAMGVGLPVVAFSCPCGPNDLIQDGYNGLLVENGNVKELAEKIITLMDNEELRCNMGKNAIPSAAFYTKERIMQQWIKLFDEL